MKIARKPVPHCDTCKIAIHTNGIRCHNALINGCELYFCYLCWPAHDAKHQAEWAKLTDAEMQKWIERYNERNSVE